MAEANNYRLAMIEDHLAQMERHIAESEIRILRHEALIAEQVRTGYDVSRASEILLTMRSILAFMHQCRERLLCEREQAGQAPYVPPPQILSNARHE